MEKHVIKIGQEFGHLKVIEEVEPKTYLARYRVQRKSGKIYEAERTVIVRVYKCRCRCGKITFPTRKALLHEHVQSCRCQRQKEMSLRPIGRREFGESYWNYVYGYYKRNARIKGIAFELLLPEFMAITSQNCRYCGAPPAPGRNLSNSRLKAVFYGTVAHNGIDRVDPAGGYTTDNCSPCCSICNMLKHTMPVKEFRLWVCKVYNHWASSAQDSAW